jgi:hypothetical protein
MEKLPKGDIIRKNKYEFSVNNTFYTAVLTINPHNTHGFYHIRPLQT